MIDEKKVERKLPTLITTDPWYLSSEADRNLYRLSQFKRRCPEKYIMHKQKILVDLEALKKDIDVLFEKKNGRRT